MLDDVKDFIKSFTDRLSSPLFGSFAISWLLINYEIPIALLFYKQKELIGDGYISYFDLICKQSNWWKFGWLPLICSVTYIVLYPWIRNGFSALHAMADSWGGNVVLKATKGQKVDISKFIELRDELTEARKRLDELYQIDQSSDQRTFLQVAEGVDKLTNILKSYSNEKDKAERSIKPDFFNGLWDFTFIKEEIEHYFSLRIIDDSWTFTDTKFHDHHTKKVIHRSFTLDHRQTVTLLFETLKQNSTNKDFLDFSFLVINISSAREGTQYLVGYHQDKDVKFKMKIIDESK